MNGIVLACPFLTLTTVSDACGRHSLRDPAPWFLQWLCPIECGALVAYCGTRFCVRARGLSLAPLWFYSISKCSLCSTRYQVYELFIWRRNLSITLRSESLTLLQSSILNCAALRRWISCCWRISFNRRGTVTSGDRTFKVIWTSWLVQKTVCVCALYIAQGKPYWSSWINGGCDRKYRARMLTL